MTQKQVSLLQPMIPLHIFQDQDRRQYNLVVIMDINFQ